jgi:hypothetical protein
MQKDPDTSFETRIQKIGGLEGDRSTLIYRITKLQQEVDTLNKENSDLHSRLNQEKARFEDFQKKTAHSSKVKTLVDKNYIGDLRYEREENLRLKHLLHNLELERNELRIRVKELEVFHNAGIHEKKEVIGRLQQKMDHVSIVEGDNRILVDKIALMQSKMQSFEKENLQIANENEKMKALLNNLEVENQDILTKVDDECRKYSNYVSAKNDELTNVRWAFKRQLKVLSVHFTFCSIGRSIQIRMLNGLLKIKNFVEAKAKFLWTFKKLSAILNLQKNRRFKQGFLAFKELVSWVGTSKISNNFIRSFAYKKFLGKILKSWKRIVSDQTKSRSIKSKSTKKIVKFLNLHMKNSAQNRLEHWKLVVQLTSSQRKVMQKLLKNSKRSSVFTSFKLWKSRANYLKNLQSIEDLSVDFAGKLVKIRFFSAFREFVKIKNSRRKVKNSRLQQAKDLKTLSILNEMKRFQLKQLQSKDLNCSIQKWKLEILSLKSIQKYDTVLSFLSSKERQKYLKTVFLSWKSLQSREKLSRVQESLNIEVPLRLKLEQSLADLSQSHHESLLKSALQMIMSPMYKSLKLSFTHWRAVKGHFKGFLHNVRYLILKHYRLNLLKGFKQWKENVFVKRIQSLNYKNNRTLMEKIELDQQVLDLKDLLATQQANFASLKQTKMRRCVAYMKNRDLANSMQKWQKKAKIISDKKFAARELRKVYFKVLSRVSFKAIKSIAEQNKKKWLRGRKMQKYMIVRCKDSLSLTFGGWKFFTRTMKNLRKLVSKTYGKRMIANKIIAWTQWKDFLNNDKFGKLTYSNQKLKEYKENLELQLKKFTEMLGESRESNQKLDKILQNKGKQRVTIALIKGCTEKWKKAWGKWKGLLNRFAELRKKSRKIVSCWINKELRQTWHSWLVFVKLKTQKNSSLVVERHKKDLATFKMETKKMKSLLEQEIETKTVEIEGLSRDLTKMERFSEFLLSKTGKNLEENYSITRAGYFFNVMKERYYNMKSILNDFASTLRTVNIRRGLRDIKGYCLEILKISSLKNMLFNVFRKYGIRSLRNEFDRWTRNTWLVNEIRLKSALKQETCKLQASRTKEKSIKQRNCEKFLKIFSQNSKSLILTNWKSVTSGIKKRKQASKALSKTLLHLRFKLVCSSLGQNAQQNKLSRLKTLKAMNLSSFNLQKLVLTEWISLHLRGKKVTKALKKTEEKLSGLFLRHSFNSIKTFSAAARMTSAFRDHSKFALLKRALLGKFSKSLEYYFRLWVTVKRFRKSSNRLLRSSVLRSFHRKLRSAFDLWNEELLLKDTVEITNTQGTVAIENGILKGRIEILNKLIQDEGIDARYVEKFILEKETKHSALTLQSINLMKYKSGLVNPKDRMIAPKYFLIWKQWVLKRKKILKLSSRLLCYTRKPDLLHSFFKWKHGLSLIINSVKKLPRRGLFSLIAKMDVDIKLLEGKLEETHKKVMFFETYSNLLASQVRRGQNMALLSCSLQQQKSMFQVFGKWVYYTSLCKIQDLLEQLTSTEQNLYIVKTTLRNLEEDNMTLVEENYELRQASLDGVAIAEAFETLTKEREKLSLDLAERTATIKKLIDQNNELADRLRSIGFDDAPEKDVLKSKRYF